MDVQSRFAWYNLYVYCTARSSLMLDRFLKWTGLNSDIQKTEIKIEENDFNFKTAEFKSIPFMNFTILGFTARLKTVLQYYISCVLLNVLQYFNLLRR